MQRFRHFVDTRPRAVKLTHLSLHELQTCLNPSGVYSQVFKLRKRVSRLFTSVNVAVQSPQRIENVGDVLRGLPARRKLLQSRCDLAETRFVDDELSGDR